MPSFGETLKRERELRQISLKEISEATKINSRYLDALEKNEFRHLPGGVFNKGFVRAFAQYIGIDPEAMVESYLEELRTQESRAQEKEKERGRRAGGEPRRVWPVAEAPRSRQGLWIAVAVIVFIAAVIAGTLGISALRRLRGGTRPPAPQDAAAGAVGGSPSEPAAPKDPAQAPPGGTEAAPSGATQDEGVEAKIVVDRPIKGSIRCDDRVHGLESLPQGALVSLYCRDSLLVTVDDAGALRIGIAGAEPVPAGADGSSLVDHRVDLSRRKEDRPGGTP
jgi:cytoskeletal protein RodZ